MKPSTYCIRSDFPGKLFIMPKPSGEWLREDILHVHAMGVDTIVSLLEQEEEQELLLEREGFICTEIGIDFLRLPTPDRGLPSPAPFQSLVCDLVERLRQGRVVAVHCRAGIGRSGMVACCALAGLGYTAQEAIACVSEARGVKVPDTQEQSDFIERMTSKTVTERFPFGV